MTIWRAWARRWWHFRRFLQRVPYALEPPRNIGPDLVHLADEVPDEGNHVVALLRGRQKLGKALHGELAIEAHQERLLAHDLLDLLMAELLELVVMAPSLFGKSGRTHINASANLGAGGQHTQDRCGGSPALCFAADLLESALQECVELLIARPGLGRVGVGPGRAGNGLGGWGTVDGIEELFHPVVAPVTIGVQSAHDLL